MNAVAQCLQGITVSEVMSRGVVTVSANADLADAVQVFMEHGISGAPVVNEYGKCVGVLSLSDCARCSESISAHTLLSPAAGAIRLRKNEKSGDFEIEQIAEGRVLQYMTPAVQTITPNQTVYDAVRYMHGERIHRLVVLDSDERPVGVISSLDILAAILDDRRNLCGDAAVQHYREQKS